MYVSNKIIVSNKSGDAQILNGTDLIFSGFSTHVFFYDHILCETILIESLKKALHLNPYISGRIKKVNSSEFMITACDSGVLFFVETYNEKICTFYSSDSSYLDRSFINLNNSAFDEYTPLLHVKLSLYENGSILGVSFYHTACDGVSFFDFLNSWGKLARNEKVNAPDFNRNQVKKLAIGDGEHAVKNIPSVKFDYSLLTPRKKSSKGVFRLTSSTINGLFKKIKKTETKDHAGLKYAVWQAYIAKLILSNQTSGSDSVSITLVYNSRSLLGVGKILFWQLDYLSIFSS